MGGDTDEVSYTREDQAADACETCNELVKALTQIRDRLTERAACVTEQIDPRELLRTCGYSEKEADDYEHIAANLLCRLAVKFRCGLIHRQEIE